MEYITIFGPNHILYLTILFIFTFLLFNKQEFVRKYEVNISKSILVVSILQQLLLYGSYYLLGEFTIAESMPFHISRINTLLGIVFLITKSPKLFNLISYFSVFAWLSFLVPSQIEPITHPRGVSFLTNHVITLLLPFYSMIVWQMRINLKYRPQVIKWFLIYFIFAVIVNAITGGNYFYLRDKPVLAFLPNAIYYPLSIIASILLFLIIERIYLLVEKHLIKN